MLGVADNDANVYRSLTHEASLGHHRVILATWRGMEKHCFYCHKPGHIKSGCQRLQRQNIKHRYAYKSLEHLVRDCPKIGSPNVGEKRARTESHVSPTTIVQSVLASQPDDSNGSKTEEIHLTTSASKYATIDPVASNIGESTSTNLSPEQTVDKYSDIDIDDIDDSDYVPPEESEESSDDSQYEEETDKMLIDSQEVEELQNSFDMILQASASNWTHHCGLISFNPSLSFLPLWSSIDGRFLATMVSKETTLDPSLANNIVIIGQKETMPNQETVLKR